MSEVQEVKDLFVIGARCLVKERPVEEKTQGGIILTSANQERQYIGTVVAVGEGATLENGNIKPMQVKVGDEVMFARFAGTPIKYKDNEYIVLNERDILIGIKRD